MVLTTVHDGLLASLGRFAKITDTAGGARIDTQCLYPSFDPVQVFIARVGGAFRVHDGAGAFRSAWDHGSDDSLIARALARQAASYELSVVGSALVGEAADDQWLASTILAVANASALAAHAAVSRSTIDRPVDLRDRIHAVLSGALPDERISPSWVVPGRSGKRHEFDFGVRLVSGRWLLVDAVLPHPASIAASYVAFADVGRETAVVAGRFAVYDRPLESDDAALIQQVADLVPVGALTAGVQREILA